jgi:hypothetical protein
MAAAVTLETLADEIRELRIAVEKMAAHQPLVDIKAAAEHMGVSTRTLLRYVANDQVPYRRIGKTLRFNLALLAPRT